MRKELLTHCSLEGPCCTPFQGAVQKVGFAEGAKRRVSSAGLCWAGRSNGYRLLTNPPYLHSAAQRAQACWDDCLVTSTKTVKRIQGECLGAQLALQRDATWSK